MPWKCYNVAPTTRAAITLRRFTWTGAGACPCRAPGGHDASFTIPEHSAWPPHPEFLPNPSRDLEGLEGTEILFPTDDPRWPGECACGYRFGPKDVCQPNLRRLWRGVLDGKELLGVFGYIGPALPPGAMFYVDPGEDGAAYYGVSREVIEKGHARPGPDGRYLAVLLPGRSVWVIDGPAWDKEGTKPCPWTRTGEPPDVTVSPSVDFKGVYHGWLRGGVLSDCVEHRRFDFYGTRISP